MNYKKFFIAENYKARSKLFQKKLKIKSLEKIKFQSSSLTQIWKIEGNKNFDFNFFEKNEYSIFGIKINLEEQLNWHQDRFSGFIYPLKRFDKIKAVQYFDKGIELVFPWEQSRFYFAINLAKKYLASGEKIYYNIFKELVLDWIKKNPFLYGVNWLSTMDIAIRAANWITALNLFWDLFEKDNEFLVEVSKSLTMHAEYIFAFPLIEKNGLTTNHTTSAYTGLLFIALAIRENPKSALWLKTAVEGLEKCIKDQVYEDGADFEGSIPYHRLVLEIFAYSTILALSNNINFSFDYYKKLFKMFEYTAAYIDENGNAQQAGDNDSGRLLIFNDINNDPYLAEHDHSYLLSIGEYIFNYEFKSSCSKRDLNITNFFPLIKKAEVNNLGAAPRDTEKSIVFEKAGAYILKNDKFILLVSCFPQGQKGKGGHNHLDAGSFTLSINGSSVIVDPGSYCYSRNKKERDRFRSYLYHNTLYTNKDDINLHEEGYWSLKKYYETEIIYFKSDELKIRIKNIYDEKDRFRTFKIKDDALTITDEYEGEFFSRKNFHPEINIRSEKDDEISAGKFKLKTNGSFELTDYEYSDYYGQFTKAKALIISSRNIVETRIDLLER